MTPATSDPKIRKPLRLWPGVLIVSLQWLATFVVPLVVPGAGALAFLAPMAGLVLLLLWWLFFSRALWLERIGAVVLMVVAIAATQPFLHESIATGAMGYLFYILVLPFVCLALVVGAAAARGRPPGMRWAVMALNLAVACGGFTLVRTGGFTGQFEHDLAWRWSESFEDRLVENQAETRVELAAEGIPAVIEWPGFRGAGRDGDASGMTIATDWAVSPPQELWRRPVGPGWSSFAVAGDLVYTQEQRGEEEVVACYFAATGEPVWRHADPVRFWESNAGAGPRGTPALADGRVFSLGATGLVNALDAADGSRLWTSDAAADTGAALPIWGFSGSPLVLDGLVVVAASGRLVAYDADSGERRWVGPEQPAGESYSSPHGATIDGVEQILMLGPAGVTSVDPAGGELLWKHDWKGFPIVQPALTEEGELLVAVSDRSGTRRLAVGRGAGGWTVEERWTTIGLKPYFNDFVVHEGHAYGFDGGILAAIELGTGQRVWKGGRYGHGQLVLLPDQDLLLVLSEKGELALVSATPGGYTELARHPAIEGKTWNHPVLVGDRLLVRNGREMVAFRLAAAGG